MQHIDDILIYVGVNHIQNEKYCARKMYDDVMVNKRSGARDWLRTVLTLL